MKANKILAVGLMTVALGTRTAAWAQHQHGTPRQQPVLQESDRKAEGKSMSLQGELVDVMCYMAMDGKGAKHKSCAQTCIGNGAPMGILTADDDLVLLLEDHGTKKPYEVLKGMAAEQVTVTGDFFKRGGLTALVVKSVDDAN